MKLPQRHWSYIAPMLTKGRVLVQYRKVTRRAIATLDYLNHSSPLLRPDFKEAGNLGRIYLD